MNLQKTISKNGKSSNSCVSETANSFLFLELEIFFFAQSGRNLVVNGGRARKDSGYGQGASKRGGEHGFGQATSVQQISVKSHKQVQNQT